MNRAPFRLAVESPSPRLHYVCEVLFGFVLQEGYVLVPLREAEIWYGKGRPDGFSGLCITPEGLLQENEIRRGPQPQFEREAFPGPEDFDGLAWAFYHLVDYAAYADPQPDAHGRHRPPANSEHLLLVEDYAVLLRETLRPRWVSAPEFSYEITIDVDQPWKYRYKPWWIQWGGAFRDLIRGNVRGFRERWRSLTGGADPFDTDALIRAHCPANRTRLFFLVDGDHPLDSRYSLRQAPYAERVRQFAKAGYPIGLHPSYQTWKDPDRLHAEHRLLQEVAGLTESSRQHYLRYQLPDTFRHLLDTGIRREYSVAFAHRTGPRNRICRPFPWFDLDQNQRTPLILVPATVMDRTLLSYLKLSPTQAMEAIAYEVDQVRRVNGHFVLILHNETFSESGEWAGWRSVVLQTLALLHHHERATQTTRPDTL